MSRPALQKKLLPINASNYYSREANWAYLSNSQFKAFAKCEAAAMAELRGDYTPPQSKALLLGSFVDAYFSGEFNEFVAAHPEIRLSSGKNAGEFKEDFKKAFAACQRLDQEPLIKALLSGRHQVIKTGRIAGAPFKCKVDSLLSSDQVRRICEKFPEVKKLVPFGGQMIVDLKYLASLDPVWSDEAQCHISFAQFWGYDIQGAIYQRLVRRFPPFVLTGITKETSPKIFAIYIPDADLQAAMDDVEARAPRYQAIKTGRIAATRCGHCPYCRATEHLTAISPLQVNYD